jgi:hypothetical protein
MPFSFPASPTVGQKSTQNGREYIWTGYAWELVPASGGGALSATVTIPGLGDPDFDKVSLLLHGNGNLTDTSGTPKTVTALGSAATSTTQAKFGTASLASLAAGDFYTVPHSTAFDFGSGNFTIEMWVYPVAGNTGIRGLFGKRIAASNAPVIAYVESSGALTVLAANTAASGGNWNLSITSSATISVGQWSHIAIVRNGTTLTAYVNGVSAGSSNGLSSTAVLQNSSAFAIGATITDPSFTPYFGGYIDEFRVSKGIARYTDAFTPSTSAYADGTGLTVPVVFS